MTQSPADAAPGPKSAVAAPALPKGGGAIRGIDESFTANPATGTASFTVPLPISPGRSGLTPELSLSYDSGAGNGPFGLGWSLNLPVISRRTDRRVPSYGTGDVFTLAGQDDLVPVLEPDGAGGWRHETTPRDEFDVDRYRPRVEGMFGRAERWVRRSDGDTHWRTISRDNVTTVFGRTPDSRVADPADPGRVAGWLASAAYDSRGNAMAYEYVAEDSANVAAGAHEQHRDERARSANRYLSRVRYGNRHPGQDGDPGWMFSLEFDYGDHVVRELPEAGGQQFVAVGGARQPWPARQDPFSTYRPGFEVRTYRLCRRVLMVHHFPELGRDDCLTRSMAFTYDENPTASQLTRITEYGHVSRPTAGEPDRYLTRSLPPVEFGYSAVPDATTIARQPLETIDEPALTDPATVWVDLDGTGSAGLLTEVGGALLYQSNASPAVGAARFGPPVLLASRPARPLRGGGGQFVDLDGDGVADLVYLDGAMPGFHQRTAAGWSGFRPFASFPAIDVADPRLRWIDLDGDGLNDLLLGDDGLFTWYPSRGPDGFGPPVRRICATEETAGPHLVFGDEVQSVFVADLSGDGLSDLVRIRNGEVCYWPSLGHGRFGAKVIMDAAPVLDHPDLFDPARIQLADTDGSGTTDIVYTGSGGVVVHLNRSGNSWSDAIAVPQAGRVERPGDVRVTDLLGTGTACVVITSPGPEPAVRYVDLMGGTKPHLLTRKTNGLGTEITLEYAPSTRFAVADAAAGRPWVTTLPFPVHAVERVITRDLVSDHVFTARYAYHHGCFDGAEREFRGFGMVERFDTEEFATGANIDVATQVPPAVTRTWFHTGVPADLSGEYYRDAGAPPLPASVLPGGLAADEYRQACRALKTAMLREEVYARDGSAAEEQPYVITEYTYGVARLQPGVFFRQPRETISYACDRIPDDPRVSHILTLDVDPASGLTRQQATVSYGRRASAPDLGPADRAVQAQTLLTWTENRYADAVDEPDDHRAGMLAETTMWELTGYRPDGGAARFSFAELAAGGCAAFTGAEIIAAQDNPDTAVRQRRVVQRSRTLYRTEDLTGLAPLGTAGPRALPGPTYRLALTPGLVASTYVRDGPLLPGPGPLLEGRGEDGGGYVAMDGAWWIPTEQIFYDPAADPADPAATAAQELATARDHFFLPRISADPFGQRTIVEHDAHDLLVTASVDALGNTVGVAHDYRVLEPAEVTDPNGNRTAVLHDALGFVVAKAMTGKAADLGDRLDGIDPDPAPATIQALAAQPLDHAAALLGPATQRFVYDVDRFARDGQPAVAVTLSRELHLHQEDGTPSPVQIRLSFTDGFGREIQVKARAEPGAQGAERWVGSGRLVLNNKGKPVRRYDPFFSPTHLYEPEAGFTGVSAELFYDPVERVVATIRPDHSYEKVAYSPWQQTTYDVNDTVTGDPRTDPDVAGLVAGYFVAQGPGWATWYQQRIDNQLGPAERDAAVAAAAHADTPSQAYLDPMGRPFLTIGENRFTVDGTLVEQQHRTTVVFDIRGNQRAVLDRTGRLVMTYQYDLDGRRLHQSSLDAGQLWLLNDAADHTIRSWDSRGLDRRLTYDELRRPTGVHVTESGQTRQAERIVYGDSPDGNLRLQVHQVYDSAGVITQARYDFAGNAVDTSRDFLSDHATAVDWASDPATDAGHFRVQRSYDALNRPLTVESPDASVYRPTFNEAGLLETVSVRLHGASDPTPFITGIDYDERGERLRVGYGNGAQTTYAYDPLTHRLASARTTRPAGPDPAAAQLFADPQVVQDLRYTYDPAGNVTRIEDAALPVIVHAGLVVEPVRTFGYDAVYRVIEATGREHAGQTELAPASLRDYPFAGGHPNDLQAMRTYTERYEYDDTGNLTRVRHHYGSSGWNRRYEYAAPTNRVTRVTTGNGTTIAEDYGYADAQGHDADGCITAINSLGLRWDYKHRLARADLAGGGTAYLGYDPADQRARKIVESPDGAGRTDRIWFEGFEIYRTYAGGQLSSERETLRVLAGQRTVALVETLTTDGGAPVADPDPLLRYQLSDHLDSSSAELDGTGALIALEEYHPYGTTSFQAGRSAAEVNLRRYRYTGRERDEETGLYYVGARYYAPWLGRWCSPDPIGLVDGTNAYVYARNNPLVYTDKPGTEPKPVVHDDNYHDLLRQAIGDVEHVSLTNREFERRYIQYAGWIGGSILGPGRLGPPDAVQTAFQRLTATSGRYTTKLAGFSPPGWRPGPADQCGTLAREGATMTANAGESVTGGGGVVLYEAVKQRFTTDKGASDIALAEIRQHIDAGRALMAGVSEPGHNHVVDPKKQPVTDHFVDIYGYETDSTGRITALFAIDNAIHDTAEVRFEVDPRTGAITKPEEPKRPDKESYLRQEYQLSEVRFHTGFDYTGPDRPKNNAGDVMFWPVPKPPDPKKK